jgi:hypothetical protein
MPEALKELREVGDGRVAEDAPLAALAAGQPLGEVGHQLGEFTDKGLLGQLHGLLKAAGHALLLLLVDVGGDAQQVAGRLDGRAFTVYSGV